MQTQQIEKMKMLVKRLPNDGLYDLHDILIEEMNNRKENSRQVASLGVPNVQTSKNDN